MGERDIYDFINEKARWILEKVDEAKKDLSILDQKEFDHGSKFPTHIYAS